jgi:hypothetical protein
MFNYFFIRYACLETQATFLSIPVPSGTLLLRLISNWIRSYYFNKGVSKLTIMNKHAFKPSKTATRLYRIPIKGIQTLSFCRSNQTKYNLVFPEAQVFQSYYGLIHHVGSPPVIGIQSHASLAIAGEATGNPTNSAFIPQIMLPYGDRKSFYERLHSTLLRLWGRCVNLLRDCLLLMTS